MILVAGASGCVGSALLASLGDQPPLRLRAFVRTEFDAVRLRDRGIEAVVGDLVDGRGLDPAMRGVETVVYLAHTIDRRGDVVANDLEAARNTTLAARAAGVRRLVYLGHVGASDETRSRYLLAKWAVERAMEQSGLPCTVLRAPLVIGDGSEPLALLRRAVDRLPIVPMFRARRTPVEPVALGDVVEALTMSATDHQLEGRSFDLCGADRITVGTLVRGWGRARGRRRLYVPLPVRGEPAAAWAAWALSGRSLRATRLLLDTLYEPQICVDPSRRFPLPHRPRGYAAALATLAGTW